MIKYYKAEKINTKDHFLVGTVWPVDGSKNNTYSIEMHDKGFTCDCQGFTYRSKCKHTIGIDDILSCEDFPVYHLS
jgi:hypothetical protein